MRDRSSAKDVVLTSFFTGQRDPQRGTFLSPDVTMLDELSLSTHGKLVVLHDCFNSRDTALSWERIEAPEVAYRQRWLSQWQWLRRHPEVRFVWLVDATDVIMLREPWEQMRPGVLYTGWEPTKVGCEWIRQHSKKVSMWVRRHSERQLLNCGVVGGDRETIMNLCMKMNDLWANTRADALHEMVFFNMAAAEHIAVVTGPQVTTEFKKYTDNGTAWWQHK